MNKNRIIEFLRNAVGQGTDWNKCDDLKEDMDLIRYSKFKKEYSLGLKAFDFGTRLVRSNPYSTIYELCDVQVFQLLFASNSSFIHMGQYAPLIGNFGKWINQSLEKF